MQNGKFRFFEFGEFRLDARRRILTRGGAPVALKNRHFDLLFALVENEGRVLSHDELIEKVWDGACIENSNIKKGISALRQILEESPGDSTFIKTVPRKGYSFVAPVRALPDEPETIIYRESETEVLIEEIEISDEPETGEEKTINNHAAPEQAAAPRRLAAAAAGESRLPFNFRGRSVIFAVLLLVVALGLGLAGWRFLGSEAAAEIDLSRMQIVPLTSIGTVGAGIISRSGELLYFGAEERGLGSLWLKNLKTGVVRQLLPPQKIHIYAADFAPDEQSLYLWMADDDQPARNGVYNLNFSGGELRKITDKEWGAMRFAPDGKRVAYVRRGINEQNESGLFTANADGTAEKLLFSFDDKRRLSSVDWSPDNNFLTYVAQRDAGNRNQYFIAQIPASGGAEQILVEPRPQPIFSAFWMPNGKGLAVSALDENTRFQQIWHLSFPAGEWRRVTNDLTWYWAARPTTDGKGLTVVQQRDIFNLWTGEADGQDFRQVTFDTLFYHPDIAWADDETILYAARTSGNTDIWEMTADGKNRSQLTFSDSSDRYPQATADGKRILFLSDRSGSPQIWQIERGAGDAQAAQVTKAASEVGRFRILPDGQTIVYNVFLPGKGWSLFKKTIDSDEILPLPFADAQQWDISPDGTEIAYLVQTKNGEKIRLATLDENKLIKDFSGGGFDCLAWTKDSKALLYDNIRDNREEILRQPVDGGAAQRLTDFNADENIWNFALSPSGKRIAARRVRQYLDIMLIKFNGN